MRTDLWSRKLVYLTVFFLLGCEGNTSISDNNKTVHRHPSQSVSQDRPAIAEKPKRVITSYYVISFLTTSETLRFKNRDALVLNELYDGYNVRLIDGGEAWIPRCVPFVIRRVDYVRDKSHFDL